MDIGLVRINLTYQGTPDQLHDALAPVGIALTRDGDAGQWQMAYAAPPKPSTTASTP